MDYPVELIPQKGYKIIDTSEIEEYAFLIRRSLLNEANTYDTLGNVKYAAILTPDQERFLFGLSHSLYGIFKIEHLKFRPEKEFNNAWEPGSETLGASSIDFTIFDDYHPLFFPIGLLHNIDFPCNPPPKRKQTKTLYGKCMLIHKPTTANFWHFELQFTDTYNNPIKASDSSWRKKAAKSFIQLTLKVIALQSGEMPPEYEIHPRLYTEVR